MEKIRTLIVDDERLARRRLRRLLAAETDIEVVGECAGGLEAAEYLGTHDTDLLFLDVQMPQVDGFGVLASLEPARVPLVVFVTAYDEYALKAFEVHAFDYLLKPFDRARFARTLEAVRGQLQARNGGRSHHLAALIEELGARRGRSARFPIKTANRVFFIRTEEIDWVEAADNYVCLHVGAERHLVRETMNAIEARLDPELFVRIHRSTIVNRDRILELRPWFHGEYVVKLAGGAELTLSRSYRDRVLGSLVK